MRAQSPPSVGAGGFRPQIRSDIARTLALSFFPQVEKRSGDRVQRFSRLYRLRKKATIRGIAVNDIVQGLKPAVCYQRLTARLKSCPVTKHAFFGNRRSFSAACEALTYQVFKRFQARATRGLACQGASSRTSRWSQEGRDGGSAAGFSAEVAERNWARVSLTSARNDSASKVQERR